MLASVLMTSLPLQRCEASRDRRAALQAVEAARDRYERAGRRAERLLEVERAASQELLRLGTVHRADDDASLEFPRCPSDCLLP